VSLGHAAFFGAGAYAAGLLAKHVTGDPLAGLALAIAVAAILGCLTSFLVLRGSDLTRLMVTLGVALVLGEIANAFPRVTGGAGWLYGGIAGAVIYKVLQDGISSLTPQYWQFWIGLFLVVFVMVGRQRLLGGLYGLLSAVRRR